MGVEWVCFGRGHFVPEILQKKLAPMEHVHAQNIIISMHLIYMAGQ